MILVSARLNVQAADLAGLWKNIAVGAVKTSSYFEAELYPRNMFLLF